MLYNALPNRLFYWIVTRRESMIISRYLVREVLQTLLAVTFVLLLIFISQQLVHLLDYVASGKIGANAMLHVIATMIPHLLIILLPLSLFLAVLLTYGRMYSDNELWIIHGGGYSIWRLAKLTGILSAGVAVVVLILSLWINPYIEAERQQALASGSIDNMLDALMPGQFKDISNDGSNRVIYVEKISRDHHRARNIFLAEQKPPKADAPASWMVLAADSGYQQADPATGNTFVVAEHGYRYDGIPGKANYEIIQFGQYRVRVPDMPTSLLAHLTSAIPSRILLQHYHEAAQAAELQMRLSWPLITICLALFAVPLSWVRPRRSRYFMLLPGILVFVIYLNLLFLAQKMVQQQTVSIGIGLWWVHVLALLLPIGLIFWRMRQI